nr:hypothetical protein [Allorhizobium sonneratiae]
MGERIQLAYFSGDLNGHAVAQLIQETLVRHDRQRFEVTILSYSGPHATRFQARWPDWLQKEVVHVDDWSSARTIDYIREQQIDILVDLQGYTGRARLDVVDACDAPVKVTYLGYPGSVMGAGLDYAITDKVVTPDSSKAFYAEKLCRLPETYQVNGTMHRRRMAALPRPALGLPEDCFVYACFNATRKIGRAEVSLWSRILHAVPGSVLAISCVKPDTRANLLAAFGEKGIGPDRLILFDYCAYDMFTARMMVSDLALDTFIYNGHTTTADALYAGLPVLTKKGSAFAGRVSESLLKAVSLPEMVAEDGEDFVARAVALARDPAALQTIRATLAERVVIDPLFDSERFTLHLETAYAMMAERARAGLPPEHFDVPARPPRTRPFLSFNEVAA